MSDSVEMKVNGLEDPDTVVTVTKNIATVGDEKTPDPLLALPSNIVREGDTVILVFGDGKKIFAQCLKS